MSTSIKVISVFCAAALLIFGIGFGHAWYDKHKSEQAQLNFPSQMNQDWIWHQKHTGIQISDSLFFGKRLRKVRIHSESAVYADLYNDGSLVASAHFLADCVPESQIRTSVLDASGQPFKLTCITLSDDQTALSVRIRWRDDDYNRRWSENFGGFRVLAEFAGWNFTPLEQEVTLDNAEGAGIPSEEETMRDLEAALGRLKENES